MVLQRSLARAYFHRGHSLVPAPVEITTSGLFHQKSLVQTCFCGSCCLKLALVEITAWGLLQWRLLAHACSHRSDVLVLNLFPQRSPAWLQSEFSGCLLLQKFSSQACSLNRHSVPLYLLLWWLLPWACTSGGSWLRPASLEVTGSGRFPQMFLAWSWSWEGPWIGPGSAEVSG